MGANDSLDTSAPRDGATPSGGPPQGRGPGLDVAQAAKEATLTAVLYAPVRTGSTVSISLARARRVPFEDHPPIRRPASFVGQRSKPGLYWFATTDRHVTYESRFESFHLLFLDRDPDVVGVQSQPFKLLWRVDGRPRRHTPDFFARHADGTGEVIDVKGALRAARPDNALTFAVTAKACAEMGMRYRVAHEIDPVVLANVSWLGAYRRAPAEAGVLSTSLVEAASGGATLDEAVRRVSGEAGTHAALVRPVLFHLLWRGVLDVDCTVPFDGTTRIAVPSGGHASLLRSPTGS